MGLPQISEVADAAAGSQAFDLKAHFRTAGGDTLRVTLQVNHGGLGLGMSSGAGERPATEAEPAPEAGATAVAAGAAPADAPSQQSVDEVLF
jgi:hypothetical protein